MSGAYVTFFKVVPEHWRKKGEEASVGEEQAFEFLCPKRMNKGGRCGMLVIAGKTNLPRDGSGKKGVPQWAWDGSREAPTFTPSINCTGCWHGYITKGRCVDPHGKDEPEVLDV